jgi:endoglucanase
MKSREAGPWAVATFTAAALVLGGCSSGGEDRSSGTTTSQPAGIVPCPTDEQFNPALPAGAVTFEGYQNDPYYKGLQSMLDSPKYAELSCQLERLDQVPVGDWVGDWTDNEPGGVASYVGRRVEQAQADGKMPILVGYNIPSRDIGQYSEGGAPGTEAYMNWVREYSAGLGDKPAVLVWEPDALAQSLDLAEAERQGRYDALHQAIQLLHDNNPQVSVYLDAGNSGWRTPEQMAGILRQVDAGTGIVKGISLNVSNFGKTDAEIAYGQAIQAAYGQELKFLVDTSRNGGDVTDRSNFCNNPDARVGKIVMSYFDPTAEVTEVWVKQPGRSDGNCQPGQAPAGEFRAEQLLTQLGKPTKPYA